MILKEYYFIVQLQNIKRYMKYYEKKNKINYISNILGVKFKYLSRLVFIYQ